VQQQRCLCSRKLPRSKSAVRVAAVQEAAAHQYRKTLASAARFQHPAFSCAFELTYSISQRKFRHADTHLADGRTCHLRRYAGYSSYPRSHPASDTPRCMVFTSLSSLKAVPISTATATAHASCCLLDRHACVWQAAYLRLRGLDSISAATKSRSVNYAARTLKLA
jgi:hypothetical protein